MYSDIIRKAAVSAFILLVLLPALSQAQVRRENPDTAAYDFVPGADLFIQSYLKNMGISLQGFIEGINDTDPGKSEKCLSNYELFYDNYHRLCQKWNMTDRDTEDFFNAISPGVLRNYYNDTKTLRLNNTDHDRYLQAGDTDNATAAALKVSAAYHNISRINDVLRQNASLIRSLSESSGIDPMTVDRMLKGIESVNDSAAVLTAPAISFLGYQGSYDDTLITVSVDMTEARAGDVLTVWASLPPDNDMRQLSGAPFDLFADGRHAATGTGRADGTCMFYYTIPDEIVSDMITFSVRSGEAGGTSVIHVLHENTSLSINVKPANVSFGDIILIYGSLTVREQNPLANRIIVIFLNDEPMFKTQTQANGNYGYVLRINQSIPSDACVFRAAYFAPSPDAVYGTSVSSSFPVSITQKKTGITFSFNSTKVTGGEMISASGRLLTEDGDPVENANITAYMGDVVIGNTSTSIDGTFIVSGMAPQHVPSGIYGVYAAYEPGPGLVLSGSKSDAISIDYKPLTPGLTFDGIPVMLFAGDGITINGTLRSGKDGKALVGDKVTLEISGNAVAASVTDANGMVNMSYPIARVMGPGLYQVSIMTSDKYAVDDRLYDSMLLVLPFPRWMAEAAAVVLLIALCLIILLATGLHKKAYRMFIKPEERPERPHPVPVKAREPVVLRPASALDFEADTGAIRDMGLSGDLKGALSLALTLARSIASIGGAAAAESMTREELLAAVKSVNALAATPMLQILDKHEKAIYGGREPRAEDVNLTLNSLKELYVRMVAGTEDVRT